MDISGTVFETIARQTGLVHHKDKIFISDSGEKFIITKFGFMPVEIYNAEILRSEISKLKKNKESEINLLKTELDDLTFQVSEQENILKEKYPNSEFPTIPKSQRQAVAMYSQARAYALQLKMELKLFKTILHKHDSKLHNAVCIAFKQEVQPLRIEANGGK
jgi:hypothetical protein